MLIPDSNYLGDSLRFNRRNTRLKNLEITSFSIVIQILLELANKIIIIEKLVIAYYYIIKLKVKI